MVRGGKVEMRDEIGKSRGRKGRRNAGEDLTLPIKIVLAPLEKEKVKFFSSHLMI